MQRLCGLHALAWPLKWAGWTAQSACSPTNTSAVVRQSSAGNWLLQSAHHCVCLLSCDAPVDVNVTGLHATQALQGLADHDGAAAQCSTLALNTTTHSRQVHLHMTMVPTRLAGPAI